MLIPLNCYYEAATRRLQITSRYGPAGRAEPLQANPEANLSQTGRCQNKNVDYRRDTKTTKTRDSMLKRLPAGLLC
jgi:hypothetical protein